MKINQSILFSSALFASLALSSCLGDDKGEQKFTFDYSNSINYVTDLTTSTSQVLDGASYNAEVDMVNGTMDMTITKMNVSSNVSPKTIKLDRVPYTFTKEGATNVKLASYTSSYAGEVNVLTNFDFKVTNRIIPQAGVSSAACTFSTNIDNRYVVRTVQKSTIVLGETEVFDNQEGTKVTYNDNRAPYVYYELKLAERKAKVVIYNVIYGGILQSALTLNDLPYTIDATGVHIDVEGPVNPVLTGDPELHKVTDFELDLNYEGYMELDLTVAGRYQIKSDLDIYGTKLKLNNAN